MLKILMTIETYTQQIQAQLLKNKQEEALLNHIGSSITFPVDAPIPEPNPNLRVFFFDIDNCLYKRSTRIHDMMQVSIHNYFVNYLQLDDEKAHELHSRYYREYGLALQGLVKHHDIDGMHYNSHADDSLDLQHILSPDLKLRAMLQEMRSGGKIDKMWLFTNAYKNHGLRVVKLLGIADLFDGITYCDYSQEQIIAKPMTEMFEKAFRESGCGDPSKAYFVDDSRINVEAGENLGMKCIHYVELEEEVGSTPKGVLLARDIQELPKLVPELF